MRERRGHDVIPALGARGCDDAAKTREDADHALIQVDLPELRHLFGELPLALLVPRAQELLEREWPAPLAHEPARLFDDGAQRAVRDRNEGVAEIERDRLERDQRRIQCGEWAH